MKHRADDKKFCWKGAGLGLIFGCVWSMIVAIGINYCHWNPVCGANVPDNWWCRGLGLIFYLPIVMINFVTLYPINWLPQEFNLSISRNEHLAYFVFYGLPIILLIFSFTLLGALIACFIGKRSQLRHPKD
jgi:hypothetical protein